ncbi:phage portal protein [Cnuibacter sp. UC19_7]|uniref:phage portal protein n=1 Tax=Cnuibacter sp. UC19_7 TaxID=3350166 RepID=UPI0036706797
MSFLTLLNSNPPHLFDRDRYEAYFDGKKRLDALGVTLPPEMRVLELIVDWPRIQVESLEERLKVQGFFRAGEDEADTRLWTWWQSNMMDTNSSLLHIETFVQGRGFGLVGPGEGDIPKITVHDGVGVRIRTDPNTNRVIEGLITYKLADGSDGASYYTPGKTQTWGKLNGVWRLMKQFDSGMSRVPLVPFVNRARIGDRHGRSEMVDVMRVTDAASRAITNLQAALELVALPTRYFLGGDGKTFIDKGTGKPIPEWEAYIGRFVTGPSGANVGSLPGANLDQITSTMRFYGAMVSSSTGMPLHYLGISGDNPPSAESLNAQSHRHITKAEKKQTLLGDSYSELMQLAEELVDGGVKPDAARLETDWRDASTPNLQSVAQAIQSLAQGDHPIIPPKVARDYLRLTPEQKRISDEWEANNPLQSLANAVGANGRAQ